MQNLGEKQAALWSISIFWPNRIDTDEHYGGYNLLQNKDLKLNFQAKFKRNIKFVICHLFLFPGLFRLQPPIDGFHCHATEN